MSCSLQPPALPPPSLPGVFGVAPTAADLGILTFQPDPNEGAVYALLHEIYTPAGMIYDLTLPQSRDRDTILGSSDERGPGVLNFPVYRMVSGLPPGATAPAPAPDVLGTGGVGAAVGEIITSAIGDGIIKHVLRLIKAPIASALREQIAAFEGPGQLLLIEPNALIGTPLPDAAAWRSRFAPAQEHPILLLLHGFNSTTERSLPTQWIPALAPRYAAILGYTHPTFTRDPLQNALDLLQQIPPDVRLRVDILAHSRGGLVARSLTELQPPDPKLHVHRLITYGSPHAGTALAQHAHWDRLISIGFTGLSWLTRLSGAGPALTFVPRGLELLLRAGSQLLFDLPGLQAMAPTSDFLRILNAPSSLPTSARYAAVSSDFNPVSITEQGFREALTAMAAQVFFQSDNDLVVTTDSMTSIDLPSPAVAPPNFLVFHTNVDHFSYFNQAEVRTFTESVLL